jgi:hypothetical protein
MDTLKSDDPDDKSEVDLSARLMELLHAQQQILEENREFRECLQQHDLAIDNLTQLIGRLTARQNAPTAASTDQSSKQLKSKQISQLFDSTPFSGSPSQDVIDWLYAFNLKYDDISLDDSQRLSIARGLMIADAKLWVDTLKKSLVDWHYFQKKLIVYFQLAAGVDSFSFSEQLYSRQQQLHETSIHYYHDVMRLCSKVQLHMDDATRLRHLYRGLRPESKVLISIDAFQIPDEFLQELVRLEQLQKVSDTSHSTDATFMISQHHDSPRTTDQRKPSHDRTGSKESQSQPIQTLVRSDRTPGVNQSSAQPRPHQVSSNNPQNRHLNEW